MDACRHTSASLTRSERLAAAYDSAGNLKRLQVDRNGPCLPTNANCNQVFAYRWDEVGRLAEARRWDVTTLPATLPSDNDLSAHLRYSYDAGDQRVLKTAIDAEENERHTVYVFETLELRRAAWLTSGTPDYDLTEWTEVAFLSANGVRLARLAWDDTDVPTLAGSQLHVLLELGDHLGSTSAVIDANQVAGHESTPKGYTWHHADLFVHGGVQMYRMQLVDAEVHATATHTGGVAQAKKQQR